MATVGLGAGSDHRGVNAYIAHMSGVTGAVMDEGRAIESRAKSDLASHRVTGAASIEIERQDTDAIVSLVDEAAISIEYGRESYTRDDGVKVGAMQGLHILARAARI